MEKGSHIIWINIESIGGVVSYPPEVQRQGTNVGRSRSNIYKYMRNLMVKDEEEL